MQSAPELFGHEEDGPGGGAGAGGGASRLDGVEPSAPAARSRAGKLTGLDATTGRRDREASPDVNGNVCALTAAAGRLYVGGSFTTIGGRAQPRLAAFQ